MAIGARFVSPVRRSVPSALMDVRVLGPIEVWADTAQLDIGSRRERGLLALLAMSAGEVVTSDRLVEELWGESASDRSVRSVYTHVSHLRRALGKERLVRRGNGYVLLLEAGELDVERFTEALTDARRLLASDSVAAALRVDEALELWRGQPFEDLGDDVPTLGIEAERLVELRLSGFEDRIEAKLATGDATEDPVATLEALVAEHPLRERLRRAQMLALYRSGRQADALEAYQDLRRTMGDELGLEPADETRRLEERILLHDPDLDVGEGTVHNLPSRVSTFIGRVDEQRTIEKLLVDHRLVTIVGPGGAGKTRLAIESAEQMIGRYPDGVWMVDLAPIEDPDEVPGAVAAALGVRDQAGAELVDAIADYLRARRVLLLLDNCEQVRSTVAAAVRRLLEAAPGLTVLTSSREPLGVPGEVREPLGGLGVPADAEPNVDEIAITESVRLFVERATAIDRAFSPDDTATSIIGGICRTLDGIPLAIELAAARIAHLDPGQIADRLTDALGLLVDSERAGRGTHTSIAATLDASYALLEPGQRDLFDRLGVFVGDFTLEAAVSVAGATGESETVDRMGDLVRASMVQFRPGPDGTRRYRLLETIRQFALTHLDERDDAQECAARHAGHYRRLSLEARSGLRGPDRGDWIGRIDGELPNFRAAFAWSRDHRPLAETLEFAPAIGTYWFVSGSFVEAMHWLDPLLETEESAPPELRADTLGIVGHMGFFQNDYERARPALEKSVELHRASGDDAGLAEALARRGHLAFSEGDQALAASCFSEALELCGRIDYEFARAWPLVLSAQARLWGGDTSDELVAQFEDAAALFERVGDPMGQTHALMMLSAVHSQARQDRERAEIISEEMLELTERTSDRGGRSAALFSYGEVISRLGDLDRGERLLQLATRAAFEQGLYVNVGLSLLSLSRIAATRGDLELAARRLGAGQRHFGMAIPPFMQSMIDDVERLIGPLDPARAEALRAEGAATSVEAALALAEYTGS